MLITKNKKAFFDYEILKKFTAGIVLTGAEVRSCRNNQVDLKGAYISHYEGKLILKGAKIQPYPQDNSGTHIIERERALLVTEKEIEKILRELDTPGITLIPLEIHTLGRLLKLEIGIARGKKQHDKREAIKQRDIERRRY